MTFTPITIYFLYFIFSRPESELCTPQNRTDTCTQEEWNPVCALYTGPDCQSPTGFCSKTLLRTCDACLDSNILGYAPGECEEPTFPKICNNNEDTTTSNTEYSRPVCGYSKILISERLRGKRTSAQNFPSALEACSSDNVVFNIRGECKDSSEIGICKHRKNDNKCLSQEEPLCAYYRGGDCTEKLCRKTVTDDGCSVCEDPSTVFYVKGSCEFVEQVSEDVDDVEELILDDDDCIDNQEFPIPELEAMLQKDGTYIYEEVEPVETVREEVEYFEQRDYVPEVEAVIMEDGTTIFEPVIPKEMLIKKIITARRPHIPELEPVEQEDGTYVYEKVKEEIDDVEPQDYIPELEAVVQDDGSVVYEEVKVPEDGVVLCVEVETPTEEVVPMVSNEEMLVSENGELLCVEIETPTEEVVPLVPNEEASNEEMLVRGEDVEPQVSVTQEIVTIETRLLVEPDN